MADPLDAFMKEGMVRYADGLRVVLAFEQALRERLVAVFSQRGRSQRWKKFRPTGVPVGSLSRVEPEICATLEGQFGQTKANLIVGVSWDEVLAEGIIAGILFAGFTQGAKFHIPLVSPPGEKRVQVAEGWGDRWLMILPKDQRDFAGDLETMLDLVEGQVP